MGKGKQGRWVFAFTAEVSAYCNCQRCVAPYPGTHFADGSSVSEASREQAVGYQKQRGLPSASRLPRIVAAPRSIPFGTVLFIESIGKCVVRDRGGAITEGKLDLFFSQAEGGHQAALRFGRQSLKVWVLQEKVAVVPVVLPE